MGCKKKKLEENKSGKYQCKKCGVLSDKKEDLCKPKKEKKTKQGRAE